MFGTLIAVLHISACIIPILIVLLQQGRGADMGASFGGGSNTFFGAGGADTLLTKVTTTVAVMFMITSVALAYRAKNRGTDESSIFTDFDAPPPAATAPVAAPDKAEGAVRPSPEAQVEGAPAAPAVNATSPESVPSAPVAESAATEQTDAAPVGNPPPPSGDTTSQTAEGAAQASP